MTLTRRAFIQGALVTSLAPFIPPRNSGANQNKSVLVIGAGMAGMAATQYLQQHGVTVTVLEGRDRIGGRIWTDNRFGVPLDLGAAWIHGDQGNPLLELAKQANVTTIATDFDKEWLYEVNGRELTDSEYDSIASRFDQIMTQLAALQDEADINNSLEQGMNQVLAQHSDLTGTLKRGVQWQIAAEILLEYGANLSELSLPYWDADEAFAGQDLIIKQGYTALLQSMTANSNIKLNQKVTRIAYDETDVTVTTSQGIFTADCAIITLPLGVLKQGQIEFSPPLPLAKQQAINRLSMGTLNKIVMKFPRAFWPTTAYTFGQFEENRDKAIEFFNMQPYHPDTALLVGLVGGSYARALESLTQAEVVTEAMTKLRTMFGQAIPEPTMSLLTQWSTDPFCYGSYSHIPPGATSPTDYNLMAEPVADRLFFAGEATHATYPSTVHGAYLSGQREAKRVLGQTKIYLPLIRN